MMPRRVPMLQGTWCFVDGWLMAGLAVLASVRKGFVGAWSLAPLTVVAVVPALPAVTVAAEVAVVR